MWVGDDIGYFDNHTLSAAVLSDIAQNNYTQNLAPGNLQMCGGYFNFTTGAMMPYLLSDLKTPGTSLHKGFLCPPKSLCVEGVNPYNGTVSFDNVLQSLELVFVIMSSNTFSDLMYDLTDSDFLVATLYFSIGIVIMTLWMMNLLVAVITSSFQVIREESKASAFTADEVPEILEDEETPKRRPQLRRAYDTTYWIWIVVIVYGLAVQCLRTAESSPQWLNFINGSESVVTLILLVEIILRFVADWRNFHKHRRNWIDLVIVVVTSIMQLPPVHTSGQTYAWLTFFQIIRIYRVVLAVPLTRDLIVIMPMFPIICGTEY